MTGHLRTRTLVEAIRGRKRKPRVEMSDADRRVISEELYEITKPTYFDKVPLRDIDDMLRRHGYLLLQEDGTAWSGLLLGSEGEASIAIGKDTPLETSVDPDDPFYPELENTVLALTWHKMPSGRVEVVAYLS